MSKKRYATSNRLQGIIASLGRDALKPDNVVMSTAWAATVMFAVRNDVIAVLKAVNGGTVGFDYAPITLLPLRWIAINRLNKAADPAVIVATHCTGAPSVAPAQATPVATPVAAPVADPWEAPAFPGAPVAIPAAPVAAPSVAPAPAAPVIGAPVAPAPVAAPQDVVVDMPTAAADVAAPQEGEPVDMGMAHWSSPAEAMHPEWDWRPASKVFGIKGLKGKVAVWPRATDAEIEAASDAQKAVLARVPPVDANFEWAKDHLQWLVMAAAESPAAGCWFWGNRGAGKTTFAEQFAAVTGRPFYGVTFTAIMEPMDFLGSDVARAGSTGWRDGTVLLGLRQQVIPPVVLLDEMSYGQSSYISGPLNEIISPRCAYTIPATGECVRFSDGALFIGADNTNGTGDVTGMFTATNVINRATMDRFAYFRQFDYLPKAQEVRMLSKRSACSTEIADKVWGILDALRKRVASSDLKDAPSVREAVAMCKALRFGMGERDAFETCFVSKYPEEAGESMRVAFTAVFAAAATPATE